MRDITAFRSGNNLRQACFGVIVAGTLALFQLPSVHADTLTPAPVKSGADAVMSIDEAVGTADILLDKLLRGETTPEAAWLAGELTYEDIMEIFSGTVIAEVKNQKVAYALVAVIDKHAPEKLADPARHTSRAADLIAGYFSSIRDSRTVAYYEHLLSLITTPVTIVAAGRSSVFYVDLMQEVLVRTWQHLLNEIGRNAVTVINISS